MEPARLAAAARMPHRSRLTALALAAAAVSVLSLAPACPADEVAGTPSAPGAPTGAGTSRQPIRFGETRLFRNLVPPPVIEAQSIAEFGQLMDRAKRDGRLLPADSPRVQPLRALLAKLAPLATKWSDRAKDWKWDVNVVRSADIRMVSLPGGKLVVYSGMLDRVRLNDDELAMLFGHEIAHALREQVREQLGEQRAPLGAVALSRLFGIAELSEDAAPALATPLASLKFDATDETEADVIGSDIASRAGFDPRASLTLWDKLAVAARDDKDRGFIGMHPYSAARRQDIIKRLPDMLALYAKARGIPVEQLPPYAGMRASTRGIAGD